MKMHGIAIRFCKNTVLFAAQFPEIAVIAENRNGGFFKKRFFFGNVRFNVRAIRIHLPGFLFHRFAEAIRVRPGDVHRVLRNSPV